MSCLVYCRTPFQALMVEAIMKDRPDDYFVVYEPPHFMSDKQRRYVDRIAAGGRGVVLPLLTPGTRQIVLDARAYAAARRAIGRRRFDRLLFANFDSLVLALLTRHVDGAFELFDDGTMSVNADSFHSRMVPEGRLRRNVRRLLRLPPPRQLVERARVHHSIFPADRVFTRPEQYRRLEPFAPPPVAGARGRVTLLLGIPVDVPCLAGEVLSAEDIARRQDVYDRFVTAASPTIFLPHPGEQRPVEIDPALPDAAAIAAEAEAMIVEDFVPRLLARGYAVDLYAFGSTALLTLKDATRARNIAMPGVSDMLDEMYVSFGVPSSDMADAAAMLSAARAA